MSSNESVPAGREFLVGYMLLRRAAHRMSGNSPVDNGSVAVDELEVMMANAQAAHVLLKYAHPEKDLSASEIDRVAELVDRHESVHGHTEPPEVDIDE